MQILKAALRGAQLLLMAVVIGLSATLVKQQFSGSAPSITTWSLVCGMWGGLVAIVGVVSIFVEPLQRLPMVVLDGLATFFFLAGSIAMAAKLGVGSCDGGPPPGLDSGFPSLYCLEYDIISGGAVSGDLTSGGTVTIFETRDWFVSRCRMAQADVAFLFFGLVAFSVALVVSFLTWKRAGRKLTSV